MDAAHVKAHTNPHKTIAAYVKDILIGLEEFFEDIIKDKVSREKWNLKVETKKRLKL